MLVTMYTQGDDNLYTGRLLVTMYTHIDYVTNI